MNEKDKVKKARQILKYHRYSDKDIEKILRHTFGDKKPKAKKAA